MRSLLSKITAVLAAGFMVLGFMAIPQAEAQDYPTSFPPPFDCTILPTPTIAFDGGDLLLTFGDGTLECIEQVIVQINPTLYDGPPFATSVVRLPIPALTGNDHVASVTVIDYLGNSKIVTARISADALAAARAAAAGGATAGGNPSAPAVVAVPAQNLAFTGSSVNLPLAAGALLVGAGGLVLLAARKRERDI